MKKRLTKVFGSQLAGEAYTALPSHLPLNVVLKSGSTLFGKLQRQTGKKIEIADNRFHKHTLDVNDIDVVVYDYPSTY